MSLGSSTILGQSVTLVFDRDDVSAARIYAQGASSDNALFSLTTDKRGNRSILRREIDGQHVGTVVYSPWKRSDGRRSVKAQIYLVDSSDGIDVKSWLHVTPSKKGMTAQLALGGETYAWSQTIEKRKSRGDIALTVSPIISSKFLPLTDPGLCSACGGKVLLPPSKVPAETPANARVQSLTRMSSSPGCQRRRCLNCYFLSS
jgi:hypothetical protein